MWMAPLSTDIAAFLRVRLNLNTLFLVSKKAMSPQNYFHNVLCVLVVFLSSRRGVGLVSCP